MIRGYIVALSASLMISIQLCGSQKNQQMILNKGGATYQITGNRKIKKYAIIHDITITNQQTKEALTIWLTRNAYGVHTEYSGDITQSLRNVMQEPSVYAFIQRCA